MSLADRLAQAQLQRGTPPAATADALSDSGQRRRVHSSEDQHASLKRTVHQRLVQTIGPKLYDANKTQAELEQQVRGTLQEVLSTDDTPLTMADRVRIAQEIADDILGYGPIEPYLRDPDLTEVMVNGPFDIWTERNGKLERVDARFNDDSHLRRTIDKIVARVGRRIDESSPMVDARLADGSRVNAVVPPLALDGSLLTIRKFSEDPFTVDDLITFGTISPAVAELPARLRQGTAQHPGLGWYRRRQDHDPERALIVHPRRRAHRHDRGRRRATARAGPRAAARGSPAEHRGQGPGHDSRPRPQLVAYAPRPHRRR